MNRSEFHRVRCLGLHQFPRFIDEGNFFDRAMERQLDPIVLHQAFDELPLQDVDRDAPCPEGQVPVRLPAFGKFGREVGILDDLRVPFNADHDADLLVGGELLDHLEREFGVGLAVQAEEGGVGDLNQGVIDLEVEEGPDPASRSSSRQLGEPSAGRAARAASVPPCPSGLKARCPFEAEEDLAVGLIDGGQLSLHEESDVFEAEVVVRLRKNGRWPRGSPGWS